jgi:hypothetical protein
VTGRGEVQTRSLADAAQQHVGLLSVEAGSRYGEIDSPAGDVLCSYSNAPTDLDAPRLPIPQDGLGSAGRSIKPSLPFASIV